MFTYTTILNDGDRKLITGFPAVIMWILTIFIGIVSVIFAAVFLLIVFIPLAICMFISHFFHDTV